MKGKIVLAGKAAVVPVNLNPPPKRHDDQQVNTHTHHTNLDTYERVIEDDVKASAIAIAATLYQLAMRDDMLPRFTKAEMPAAPAPRGTSSQ